MITNQLINLAVTTPYSLDELKGIKYYYCLTDFGLGELCEQATMKHVSLQLLASILFISPLSGINAH